MKRILFFLSAILMALHVGAVPYNADNLPKPDETYGRVVNPDGILSQAEVDSINSLVLNIERAKNMQFAIIVVNEVVNGDVFDFGVKVFNKWGIGGKANRGLMLVLSVKDRDTRIITGNGLEGELPDAVCNRIFNKVQVPLLKESKWAASMTASIITINEYLDGNPEVVKSLSTDEEDGDGWLYWLLGGGGIVGWAAYSAKKATKCPQCADGKIAKNIEGVVLKEKEGRKRVYMVPWVCNMCGHIVEKEETHFFDENDPDDYDPKHNRSESSGGSGFIGGSGRSSSRSSGSFSSWGGGHTSGGGSGGRF